MNTDLSSSTTPRHLSHLRLALAISQGTQLLARLRLEYESTVSHDQAKRVTYLTELFSRIHRELFQDWRKQATAGHKPGSMMDPEKRAEFRIAIEQLVLEGTCNEDTAIFDNNGFVIHTFDIAERLADFYHKMRKVRPFLYGNRISLDCFVITLGRLPAFHSVYEQGIDFRRLTAQDTKVLHDLNSPKAAITVAFQNALDPTLSKNLLNKANAYGKWPENKVYINGVPFLSHASEQYGVCLVLVNGGLIPKHQIEDKIFVSGKQFADSPIETQHYIVDYLPGTENLRAIDKTEIDGIDVSPGNPAPLFCLDVNMLTGLRSPSHTELLELIKQCEGEDKQAIFKLADNEELKNKLLYAAKGDERLIRTVEIAYERLSKIYQKLEAAKLAIFEGKKNATHPLLFLSMGGAGAGKTAVEEIARAHCQDNYVIASLDEFRKISDLYTVLTAANHHSDDYIYVEPFANRLRQMVADEARKRRVHLLYDGTAIPYSPRYKTIVEQFKASGFITQTVAVDAFLIKPKGREQELQRTDVITSVKSRYQITGRALPWVVTLDKHIRAPYEFLTALQHQSLDKITLFANDGDRDQHYLVAESFAFTDLDIQLLHQYQLNQELKPHYSNLIANHDESILRKLAQDDKQQIEQLLQRNPNFDENNLAYLVYNSRHGNRILLIYNTRRMIDFIEKKQLNPYASGEDGLLHKAENLCFDIDSSASEPWIKRLQGSL